MSRPAGRCRLVLVGFIDAPSKSVSLYLRRSRTYYDVARPRFGSWFLDEVLPKRGSSGPGDTPGHRRATVLGT